MVPALAADTAVHLRGIGSVLEVVPAGRRQGRLQFLGPFLVGPGESPHLVGGQAEVTQYSPERLAAVDGIQHLRAHVNG
jgi:hypothetical protein